jgi:hypothetical protein
LKQRKKQRKFKAKPDGSARFCHPSPPHVLQRLFLFFVLLLDGVSLLVYVLATAACAMSSNPKLPF